MIGPEKLRELLKYDPNTGNLTWKVRPSERKEWNTRFAGRPAFTTNNNGHRRGRIFNERYLAHRVAYAIYHGEWPSHEVDHWDGDRSNNKISNLRPATKAENSRNARMSSNNISGFNGVSWHSPLSKWRASLRVDGKDVHLGYFSRIENAAQARLLANEEHGFSERHGT